MKNISYLIQFEESWNSAYSKTGKPRYNTPTTIEITSFRFVDILNSLSEFNDSKCEEFDFEKSRDYLYSLIPDNFIGKVMNNRKNISDFMPVCTGIGNIIATAVISERFKNILEEFPLSSKEYILKNIDIYLKNERLTDKYYLMIMPYVPRTELILSKCVYVKESISIDSDEVVQFSDDTEWNNNWIKYTPIQFTLPAKYKHLQMLYIYNRLFISYPLTRKLMSSDLTGFEYGRIRLFFDEP